MYYKYYAINDYQHSLVMSTNDWLPPRTANTLRKNWGTFSSRSSDLGGCFISHEKLCVRAGVCSVPLAWLPQLRPKHKKGDFTHWHLARKQQQQKQQQQSGLFFYAEKMARLRPNSIQRRGGENFAKATEKNPANNTSMSDWRTARGIQGWRVCVTFGEKNKGRLYLTFFC